MPTNPLCQFGNSGWTRLCGAWPVQQKPIICAAWQNVNMEMPDGLVRGRSVRLHEADAGRPESAPHGDRDPHRHSSNAGKNLRWNVEDSRVVPLGDNETMAIIRRMDVHEGQSFVVLGKQRT